VATGEEVKLDSYDLKYITRLIEVLDQQAASYGVHVQDAAYFAFCGEEDEPRSVKIEYDPEANCHLLATT
jgi:hypothetical protein